MAMRKVADLKTFKIDELKRELSSAKASCEMARTNADRHRDECQAVRRKLNDLLKEHKKLLDAFYHDW